MLSLAAGKELTEAESCKLLSAVGLCSADYLNRQMDGTLSGGEMKRLEIATVLAKPHKVSIFDEPEAGIDLWSFSMLIKRFEEIHKEKKECLILISHQERIIQMADKIMVIEDGQVKEYGTKEDVLPTLFQQKTGRMCGQEGRHMLMVQVDETTQGVLNQISEGFEQKGAYNLRQNGIPLCHGDSEHIKIRKKRISRALIF